MATSAARRSDAGRPLTQSSRSSLWIRAIISPSAALRKQGDAELKFKCIARAEMRAKRQRFGFCISLAMHTMPPVDERRPLHEISSRTDADDVR